MTDKARNAITEARTWLEEHPTHHSARRKDVKALINALEDLLDSPAGNPDAPLEVKQYALQVKGSTVRNEPHRMWTDLAEAEKHADLMLKTFGDEYEIVERVKAGPWTVRP